MDRPGAPRSWWWALVALTWTVLPAGTAGAQCIDLDGDGWGSPGDASCPEGADVDCDDTTADRHPGAPELCNGLDDDCDGVVPVEETDDDGDGLDECAGGDCDDTDASSYPDAPELCDGIDNDCDGAADEEVGDDLDGDGFSPCDGDCDDDDDAISPTADEVCDDGRDNDCDGDVDADDGECAELAPIADAGEAIEVTAVVGATAVVHLDGSASAGAGGASLVYLWTVSEGDDDDAATRLLTDPRTPHAYLLVRPRALAEAPLELQAQLVVEQDSADEPAASAPATVDVTVFVEEDDTGTWLQCSTATPSPSGAAPAAWLLAVAALLVRRTRRAGPSTRAVAAGRRGRTRGPAPGGRWAPLLLGPLALLAAVTALTPATPARAARAALTPWVAPPPDALYVPLREPLPSGMGALLIPSLTGRDGEPDVLLVDDDGVQRIPIGTRVVLPPGRFVVLVGSAEPSISAGVTVDVLAGQTTVAPVVWGGLVVEVVNRRTRPIDGAYELVHVETGVVVELPPELRDDGERQPDTWLLAPGLYRIQEPDMTSTTRRGFATVYVPAGGLVTFRAFMDPASGMLLGGGVVPVADASEEVAADSPWDVSLAMGVDGSFSGTQNQIGWANQSSFDGSAFVNFRAQMDRKRHGLLFELGLEEGATWLRPSSGAALPPLKSRDMLGGGVRYSLKFNEGFGLYARGFAETRLFPTTAVTAEDRTIALRHLDGSVEYEQLEAPESYRIADAWRPTVIRAGGGLEPALVRSESVDLAFHVGGDYRAYLFDGVFRPDDNPDTPALEYTELQRRHLGGFVGGVDFAVRAAGWFSYTTRFEAFIVPTAKPQVVLEWDNNIGLSITRHLSLNYRVLLERMPYAGPGLQLQHGAYLRFAWSVL